MNNKYEGTFLKSRTTVGIGKDLNFEKEISESEWKKQYLCDWMDEREDDDNDYSVDGGQPRDAFQPWYAPAGLRRGNITTDSGSGMPEPGVIVTDFEFTSINLVENPLSPETAIGNTVTAASPEPCALAKAPSIPENMIITGNNGKNLLTLDFETGHVAFGEEYNTDEASEIFWTSMGKDSPDKLKKEIAELKAELSSYVSTRTTQPCNDEVDNFKQISGRGVRKGSLEEQCDEYSDQLFLPDIEYFRRRLVNSLSLGDLSAKEVKKQLTLLEDSEWVARCNRPKRGTYVERLPLTPEERFQQAMKVLD